jgi:hypothetical protein
MAQYKLKRDWFDGRLLHYAGEVVEADPDSIPSSAMPIVKGKAEPGPGGELGAGGVGSEGASPAPLPAETLVPAPHKEHEVGGAIATDPTEPALPIDPRLDFNQPVEELAADEGTPEETTHNKPGSTKATQPVDKPAKKSDI